MFISVEDVTILPKHVVSMNNLKIFTKIAVAETYKSEYLSLFVEHKECVGSTNC